VSPCLRVENADPATLSVPGVPILISIRPTTRPFG
jgi:hypothetical protein